MQTVKVTVEIKASVKSNLSKEENAKLAAHLKNCIAEYADLQVSVMLMNNSDKFGNHQSDITVK